MRTRLNQALALAAVLTAGATASSPARSADLPPEALPPVYGEPLPPQNVFEGWWLGGTIGGATINYDFAPDSGQIDSNGILGGVVGGWSWQNGPVVVGVEGDFFGADISGSRHFNNGANEANPNIDTMADLRLRAGVTVMPRVLLFATFGGAWANTDLPVTGLGGGSGSADFFGWSVGGGAEVALNPHWSARFDYQFTDFSSETVNYPGGSVTYDPDANSFRGSAIYRF
ncbi:MAG TPA: outer membrane beta-barrel protein [Methyloceanibacter sp.]|jgi:outer membrane immunogenic protein|nr:outer membrane beta-barrel protein [Methyloceanibacter sp.]